MIWVIPIGGKGTRTRELGEFKPFIEIKGQKILSWLLYSLKDKIFPNDKLIFTTTDYLSEKYSVKREVKKILHLHNLLNNFFVFESQGYLAGSSLSIYMAKPVLNTKESAIISCCDQYIDFQLPSEILPKSIYLTLIADFTQQRGYVSVENGKITRFEEKKAVSNLAHCGITLISEGQALIRAIEKQIANNLTTNGEFCPGPALNYLLEEDYSYHPLRVMAYYDLGNLPDINYFINTPLIKNSGAT